MINSVRQTVMSVLNKNNYGYISPSDFNLYAKQAQLDIFEDYFYKYNNQINKENGAAGRGMNSTSGTGYADISQILLETIESFSVTNPLLYTADPIRKNNYFLPSLNTTGDEAYLMNKVYVYDKTLASGVNTSANVLGNELIDTAATFISSGVKSGDIVSTIVGGITYSLPIINVANETELFIELPAGVIIFDPGSVPQNYIIYDATSFRDAEKVSQSKINMLNRSILTKPSLTYPAYTQQETHLNAYPNEVVGVGQVFAEYIRFPKDPKWTYVNLTAGEPSFDASASDYQDFELPKEDEVNLISKILQYSGMSIREIAAVQFGQAEQQNNDNKEAL